MIEIPLEQIPNQKFEIILNQQDCTIHLYVRGDYLYFDLAISNEPYFYGAICLDRTLILQMQKDTFNGNFIFIDTLGKEHPEYTKLNDRYKLYYLTNDEVAEFNNLILSD
ncbi:MAG: hypothetical protein SPF17_05475 [Candidatus Mucispirillum faecigallinarum]|nr:hypothetical protein [Candidatus Mucispirillum faecigallinarum]